MKSILLLLAFLIPIAACEKKPPAPKMEFDVEATADEAFDRIVSYLQGNGFSVADLEPSARKVTTTWKNITAEELEGLAPLAGPLERYEGGRVMYSVSVEDVEGRAHLRVKAALQGDFRAKQGGVGVGGEPKWAAMQSNGAAEQALVSAAEGT